LPFENLSGDPEQEYFVDGMRYTLGTELGKIRALTVKGQLSAARYKGTDMQTRDIAMELGVDAVITGSVYKAANKVRITAHLIHGPTEENLWGKSYEGDLVNVLTLQREVALGIAREIKVKLTLQEEERLATARPINPKAHDAYLKGRFFWNKRSEDGLKTAISYFEEAKDLDPNYALAYAGLADCHILLGVWDFVPSQDVFPRAKREALRALEIDDTLGEAYASLAFVVSCYDRDWSKADREFQQAIKFNPHYATAHHWYANFLGWMGRFEEALVEIERAQDLEPLSLIIGSNVGYILCLAGKYDEAIKQLHEVLQMDADFLPAFYHLAATHTRKSMFEENIALYKKAATLRGRDATSLAGLAFAYAATGNIRETQTLLQEALVRSKEEYVPASLFSLIYAHLNDKNRAFNWLNKVIEQQHWSAILLKVDPFWDPLRKDPRFNDVLKQMNFPETPETVTSEKLAKSVQDKIAVPAIKKVSLEPLPSQTSLLMSRGNSIAISPDGKYLVYVGVDALGTRRLYLRDMTKDFEATPIRGTEGAMCPFFRPDGEWIGFFAKDESTAECALKRVRTQSGLPEFICRVAPVPCGGSWSQDGFIIYSPIYHISLIKVAAFGDAREYVVRADPNNREHGQAWPDILPEGKGVLYTVWGGDSYTDYRTMIKWQDIDKPHELIPNSSFARYVPTGHIVFLRDGSLQAVRFDIDHPGPGAIKGETKILQEDIGVTAWGSAQFAFSRDEGTLVYVNGSTPFGLHEGEMVWVDPEEPNAAPTPIPDSRRYYDEWCQPRLSPDEKWIAVTPACEANLLLYKFGIGFTLPLTVMKGYQACAVWEPQTGSNHVVFYSLDVDSPPDLYWRLWNNDGKPELIYKDSNATEASSFSPDGKYLAFTAHYVLETSLDQTSDIWLLETETKKAEKWTNTPQWSEGGAAFSPDGKWIAYTSDQMGEHEVYVRGFPAGRIEKIGAGSETAWGPDKEKMELFYRDGKQFIRAQIQTEPQFKVEKEALFEDRYIRSRWIGQRNYDVSKDGKRFLMIKQVDERPTPVTRLKVVENWFEELKRLVPAEKD
ncbi:MAG: TPR end-of-group domain-containing protein, partial [Planctomycetota bacterium]